MFARFIQGFAISIFFLPIVQIALGEIPQARYASASGLFHFIRILVGSGFGTSLSIQLWTRLEIFHHARISEAITNYNPTTTQAYQKLSTVFDRDVINGIVDQSVEQQAFMLSTNDLSWLGAWLFLGVGPCHLADQDCQGSQRRPSSPASCKEMRSQRGRWNLAPALKNT